MFLVNLGGNITNKKPLLLLPNLNDYLITNEPWNTTVLSGDPKKWPKRTKGPYKVHLYLDPLLLSTSHPPAQTQTSYRWPSYCEPASTTVPSWRALKVSDLKSYSNSGVKYGHSLHPNQSHSPDFFPSRFWVKSDRFPHVLITALSLSSGSDGELVWGWPHHICHCAILWLMVWVREDWRTGVRGWGELCSPSAHWKPCVSHLLLH